MTPPGRFTVASRAALVALVTAVALVGCGGDEDGGTTTAAKTRSSGVYFVVDTRAGLRLAREQRDLPADRAPAAAVEAMIAGPQDPDYTTTWNPATRVLEARAADDEITVDLSGEARTANVGSPGAALMIQQLVYTVTEAAGRGLPVRLLIDGAPAGELWGAVSWDGPVRRDPPIDVRVLMQIDSPREGETVSSPVAVSGEAAAFEANVPWRVLDGSGTVVRSGAATSAEGQRFAPFSFDVALDPGAYTIEIREDDPSDGEGGPPMVDTRRITVR